MSLTPRYHRVTNPQGYKITRIVKKLTFKDEQMMPFAADSQAKVQLTTCMQVKIY